MGESQLVQRKVFGPVTIDQMIIGRGTFASIRRANGGYGFSKTSVDPYCHSFASLGRVGFKYGFLLLWNNLD